VGLTQVFWGETAECVCQGLRSVFESMGGVPRRAVFDNATEVGRRVGGGLATFIWTVLRGAFPPS